MHQNMATQNYNSESKSEYNIVARSAMFSSSNNNNNNNAVKQREDIDKWVSVVNMSGYDDVTFGFPSSMLPICPPTPAHISTR